MDVEKILGIFSESKSKSDVYKKLGYHNNGSSLIKINKLISEYNIDISHFDNGVGKRTKHKEIEKVCPICDKNFKTKPNNNEKTTCSHACANTFFRSNVNHPNWSDDRYTTTCFHYHQRKCVICDEEKILDVHHYDKNRENNKPENLIPMCPTHHRYIHSNFKDLVESKVIEYRGDFIEKMRNG